MAKALHGYIRIIKDGKTPIGYDRADSVNFLIDGANSYLVEKKNGPPSKVALSESIFNLMSEYEKNGPTINLMLILTKFLGPIKNRCLVEREKGQLVMSYIAELQHRPEPGVFACYMFSAVSSNGWLAGLKRCKNPDCTKFFIGKSNRSWCSSGCGSHFRVKKMRKKNRKDEI